MVDKSTADPTDFRMELPVHPCSRKVQTPGNIHLWETEPDLCQSQLQKQDNPSPRKKKKSALMVSLYMSRFTWTIYNSMDQCSALDTYKLHVK